MVWKVSLRIVHWGRKIMAPYIAGNVTKTTHILLTWTSNLQLNSHFVTKTIYPHFAKKIYALCPESFCALKFAIWKVQTLWASGKGRESDENNSERPVDALAEKHQWLTHWQTTWNQEMLAHLKVSKPKFIIFFWPASGDIAGWLGNKWIKRNYCGRRTDRRKSKRSLQT